MRKATRILVTGDHHVPYHSPWVVACQLQALKLYEPDEHVVLGDLVDFSSLSLKFGEQPRDQRLSRIGFEVDQSCNLLKVFAEVGPKPHLTVGNHDNRMAVYLAKHAKALKGYCEEITTRWSSYAHVTPYQEILSIGPMNFLHGDLTSVRKNAGETAKAHLDFVGGSLIIGHTHRGGGGYRTTASGTLQYWENFCSCRMDLPWARPVENWQLGFSVIDILSNSITVHQHRVSRAGWHDQFLRVPEKRTFRLAREVRSAR